MKLNKNCVTVALIFCWTFQVSISAPSRSSYKTSASDYDDDHDTSPVIDANGTETDFGTPFGRNDKVISQVLNINDAKTDEVLSNFNVTMDFLLRRISNHTNSPNGSASAIGGNGGITDPNSENEDTDHVNEKGQFMELFKRKIESAVYRNASKMMPDASAVVNHIAFYPVCSKNDETSWLAENTAKLYFSSTMFLKLEPNTYLHKAELRLLQKNPDQDHESSTTPVGCAELDEVITVTVSVMVKRNIKGGNNRTTSSRRDNGRREVKYKKRVCNSFTISKRRTGWIAVNVEQVIRQWEKAYRLNISNSRAPISDPMLLIDVEDQDKNQLKAGMFFEPTDCQASTALPWTVYGETVWNKAGSIKVPPYPRLDIKWSRLSTTQYSYNHPFFQNHHHNFHHHIHSHRRVNNKLENFRLLRSSDSDQHHHNFRYLSEDQQNHRKRHIHHKQQSVDDINDSNSSSISSSGSSE